MRVISSEIRKGDVPAHGRKSRQSKHQGRVVHTNQLRLLLIVTEKAQQAIAVENFQHALSSLL